MRSAGRMAARSVRMRWLQCPTEGITDLQDSGVYRPRLKNRVLLGARAALPRMEHL